MSRAAVHGSLSLQFAGHLEDDSTHARLPGHRVEVVQQFVQTPEQAFAENLEIFPLNSRADSVLVSQVVERLVEGFGIVEQVDSHVEGVDDAHHVSRELRTQRVINVDILEQVLRLGLHLDDFEENLAAEGDLEFRRSLLLPERLPLRLDEGPILERAAVFNGRPGDTDCHQTDE